MGVSASAHRVSCAHDPLKPHPVRQDVHSAQEMTLIDRTLFTERRGEAAGENEAICTMAVLGWCCTFTRGGTCVCVCVCVCSNRCKYMLEVCIYVHVLSHLNYEG